MRILVVPCLLALALAVSAGRDASLKDALAKSRVDGKYGMLLHQIEVAKDRETYGDFRDWGFWSGTAWGGAVDLSPGYWVYVYPYWYVWRDEVTRRAAPRRWGPEQATGAPDTPRAGDFPTAWASATADGADEWLLLEFERPMRPIGLVVFATYNPGALVRVTAFALDGRGKLLWKGDDPAVVKEGKGVTFLPLDGNLEFNRVRLDLASKRVEGWNEIDAVGLLEGDGRMHWASAAHASSYYGESGRPMAVPASSQSRPAKRQSTCRGGLDPLVGDPPWDSTRRLGDFTRAPYEHLRIDARIDGSGKLVFTDGRVRYEHRHWGRPTRVRFDGKPWTRMDETPRAWSDLRGKLDLTRARILDRKGRDVIALESTTEGFDLHLCDSPNGAADYAVTLLIPRRR